jgi:hypothetical protein
MTTKRRPRGSDSQGPTKVILDTATTARVPRRGDHVSLDPDLWIVLAVLDRTFGTDQVSVVAVAPRRWAS